MDEPKSKFEDVKDLIDHLRKFEEIFIQMGLLVSGTTSALEGLRMANHNVENKVTVSADILADVKARLARVEFHLENIGNFLRCPLAPKK